MISKSYSGNMGMICTLRGSISFGKAVNYKIQKTFHICSRQEKYQAA